VGRDGAQRVEAHAADSKVREEPVSPRLPESEDRGRPAAEQECVPVIEIPESTRAHTLTVSTSHVVKASFRTSSSPGFPRSSAVSMNLGVLGVPHAALIIARSEATRQSRRLGAGLAAPLESGIEQTRGHRAHREADLGRIRLSRFRCVSVPMLSSSSSSVFSVFSAVLSRDPGLLVSLTFDPDAIE
jgi:hypothetical protein